MRTRQHHKIWMIGCVVAAGLALVGCRENETNRVVHFEKGTFPGGAPAEAISDDGLSDLRHRMKQTQSFN